MTARKSGGRGRGRPTKLTDAVRDRICAAISAGSYYASACALAGIDYSTFKRWAAGAAPHFRAFRAAVARAEAEAEVRLVAQWQSKCPTDWKACRDFLARRFPARWGARQTLAGDPARPLRVDHQHEVDAAAELGPVLGALIDSLVRGGAAALGGLEGGNVPPHPPALQGFAPAAAPNGAAAPGPLPPSRPCP